MSSFPLSSKGEELTRHKKISFSLRISLVNVTQFTEYCGFGHIY